MGKYERENYEEAPPYLELRKQLKDSIRVQMNKENNKSSLGHSHERQTNLPFDDYGSFFGPSESVLAPRVIRESMSLLKNKRLMAKVPMPNHNNKISASTSSSGGSKNHLPNEIKNKVQQMKVARDYSFLFDDAEPQALRKDALQNVSDDRSSQMPPKNKHFSKQLSSSKQSCAPNQSLDQRKGYQDSNKEKFISKQPVASSKPQISKPSTNVPSCPTRQKDPQRKRPVRPFSDVSDDLGDGSGVSSIIQRLMGYNPNKYQDCDLDDCDMVVSFDDMMKEEKQSAKIARMEDEEELRKIEEEERRERLRKRRK